MPWRGLDFVITGTGRSGTGYAAALFTAAGLPCSHEEYFRFWPAWFEAGERRDEPYAYIGEPYHRTREGLRRLRSQPVGDASWMAVPRLGRFRGQVFLQVRHPLQVVRSLVGNRFFTDPDEHGHYHAYATRFFELTGDPAEDALRWWVEWNQRAERHAAVTYRLESLDLLLLADLLHKLGVDDATERAGAALPQVPTNVHNAAGAGWDKAELGWDDLPASRTKSAAAKMAERFGYDVGAGPEIDLRRDADPAVDLTTNADADADAESST